MSLRPLLCVVLVLTSLLGRLPACAQSAREAVAVRAPKGMVASAEGLASQVGADILAKGGNAVDAAVAVGLALAVTYPAAGNLGGGGFMFVRMHDGRTVAIDYREVGPALATRDLYLDKSGNLLPNASLIGHRAVGVPGTVAGFALALERYGTMKWADVVEPARRLAAEGFPVSRHLARSLRASSVLKPFPESVRIFLKEGKFYAEGEKLRQPELAETLHRLQEAGPREFYEGRTAQLIAEEMQANGGLVTREDLKDYRAVVREPLRGTYRGYDILTMPPPSSGGIALLEMLNLLEGYDLAAMRPDSAEQNHLLIEVMRRAFADRAEFPGDPGFVKVPVAGLTSKKYAAGLAKSIDLTKATPSAQVGHGSPAGYESPQTTHYSVVDAQGNAVSNTYTLNMGFGSGVTVKGAGFLLNNEMDDFASKPGSPNGFGLIQGEANAVGAHKRPLSSMTPTIVVKEGKLVLVVGSPGGPTIINTVLQVLLNVIDHKMDLQKAVAAPRLHHQWMPDTITYEPRGLSTEVMEALKARGHAFGKPVSLGDVQAIAIDPKTGDRIGVSDPRSPDGKAIGH